MTDIALTAVKFASFATLPAGLRASAKLEWSEHERFTVDQLVYRLKAYVYGYQLGEEVHSYPANWIEAVKERWAPAWLLRRWPVQFTDLRFVGWHLYPEIVIQGHKPIRFVTTDRGP